MDTDSTAKGAGNTASTSSSSLGAATSSPMERNNSQSSTHKATHIATHRQSFAENQRYPPPSPRNQRHPSFTQQALLELMNNPPSNRHPNPRYAGRDWRDIGVGELAVPEDVRWAELDLSVQDATMVCLPGTAPYPLVATDKSAVSSSLNKTRRTLFSCARHHHPRRPLPPLTTAT
jgi:hypothetical protein